MTGASVRDRKRRPESARRLPDQRRSHVKPSTEPLTRWGRYRPPQTISRPTRAPSVSKHGASTPTRWACRVPMKTGQNNGPSCAVWKRSAQKCSPHGGGINAGPYNHWFSRERCSDAKANTEHPLRGVFVFVRVHPRTNVRQCSCSPEMFAWLTDRGRGLGRPLGRPHLPSFFLWTCGLLVDFCRIPFAPRLMSNQFSARGIR